MGQPLKYGVCDSEFSLFNKGLCLMKSGRTDEALTCFNKALEINSGLISTGIYKVKSLK